MRKCRSSSITSSIVSALVVASVTLAVGWPSSVNALGEEERAAAEQSARAKSQAAPAHVALRKDESRIDELTVSATLATSESDPHRRVIRLECHNPTEQPINGRIRVSLTRIEGNTRERVMPRPRLAWSHPQTVAVAAGASVVREIPLPKELANQVGWIEKNRKSAEAGKPVAFPAVYFDVTAEPVGRTPQGANRSSAQPKAQFSKGNRSKLASNSFDMAMSY